MWHLSDAVVVAVCYLTLTCSGVRSTVNKAQFRSRSAHNSVYLDDAEKLMHVSHPKGELHVDWGLSLPYDIEGVECDDGEICVDYGTAKVVVNSHDHCQEVLWTTTELTELKDCILIEGHWYGGGEQISQPWPIEKVPRPETPFVTADMLQKRGSWYGGVTESYWISSQGAAVRVEDETPLHLSLPDEDGDDVADKMCFAARHEPPFVASSDTPLILHYHICTAPDVRQVHEMSYPLFFSYPSSFPDERMIQDPVWSTWAQYHMAVNDSRVLDFAHTIQEKGFNNSQVEIDDNWDVCYGDMVFNPERFPDPKKMVDQLHSEGFRVTLWIHPFINDDCATFAVADQAGYFVKDGNGTTHLTHWWQGLKAGIIDFTNPEAAQWFSSRLTVIRSETGIDSFKFDGGEASWLPDIYTLGVSQEFWPNAYTTEYVNTLAEFGGMVETRVGHGTQHQPIFVRMLDKDSLWGNYNGLRTMVPSLLHFGILGYPFVLPDMVGGNAYAFKPNKELFVRWAQANAFMPSIQFSLFPWDIDQETTDLCKAVTSLHTSITPLILALAEEATETGAPMMRPTWWLCPTNEDCLTADQQFLLGNDILVAPVVEKGATSVTVVLPPGQWERQDILQLNEGPAKITIENITLDTILYFVKQE